MSVDKTPTGVVYTVTNGTAGQQYPLTFPYIKGADVKAYYVANGKQTVLTYGIQYTVEDQTLTALVALPVGAKLAIYRQTDLTQEIVWKDGQAVYTPDIMKADDKLTLIAQEIAADMSRTIKLTREEEAAGEKPEGVMQSIYGARDAAAANANVASNKADEAASSAQASSAKAADAAASAVAAAQSAVEAEAASMGLAPRVTAIEQKNSQQDTRLDAVELKNTQQDLRLETAEAKLSTTKRIVVLTSSGAFHAPVAGDYRVTCIGGGGAGGAGGASSINGGGQGGTTTFKDVSAAGGSGGGNGRPAIGGYGGATSGGSGQAGKVVVGYVHLEDNEIVNYIVGAGGIAGASTTGSGAGPEGGPAANCNWIVGGGARGASHGIVGRGSHDNQGANFGGGGDSNGTGYGGGGPGGNAVQNVQPVQLTGPDGAGSTNTSTGAGGNGGNGAIILEFSA